MTFAKEVLVQARELIENEKNWTVWTLARNKDNAVTVVEDPQACKFCAMGAIAKVVGSAGYIPFAYRDVYSEGNPKIKFSQIVDLLAQGANAPEGLESNEAVATVNDELGHQMVLNMYDKAIESQG